MHLRPIVAILQLLANSRQFEEGDHCCCSNFKYELFIKAGARHVRTGPPPKKIASGLITLGVNWLIVSRNPCILLCAFPFKLVSPVKPCTFVDNVSSDVEERIEFFDDGIAIGVGYVRGGEYVFALFPLGSRATY